VNTSPSLDDLLEALVIALQDEVLPYVSNPKAQATTVMMQSIIQQVRQTLPVLEGYLIEEHNGMTRTLRDLAERLGDARGPEADRVRERATTLGQLPDLPAPVDAGALRSAHRRLGEALVETLVDLDALQRGGDRRADEALTVLRAHFGPRYVRDVQTTLVGSGFIGRG